MRGCQRCMTSTLLKNLITRENPIAKICWLHLSLRLLMESYAPLHMPGVELTISGKSCSGILFQQSVNWGPELLRHRTSIAVRDWLQYHCSNKLTCIHQPVNTGPSLCHKAHPVMYASKFLQDWYNTLYKHKQTRCFSLLPVTTAHLPYRLTRSISPTSFGTTWSLRML